MDDSDESGPYFDDYLSPGGQHFTFSDFHNMEIQNLMKVRLNEKTVAINEYGTNLLKYKFDPLAVTEAKVAMAQGKGGGGCSEGNQTEKCTITPPKENVNCEMEMVTQTSQPSPSMGSQEAPAAEWSSQEDNALMIVTEKEKENRKEVEKETKQSPNWETIEDELDEEETVVLNTSNSVKGNEETMPGEINSKPIRDENG
jgi:hypothetical protein